MSLKTILENYKTEADRLAAMRKKMVKPIRSQLAETYRELLDTLPPEIGGLVWYQYAPYFNDGEPCEFSVREILFTPNFEANEDEEAWEARMTTILGGDVLMGYGREEYCLSSHRAKNVQNPFITTMQEIENIHTSIPEEIHMGLFGSDNVIRLNRGESTFRVEEYDQHD